MNGGENEVSCRLLAHADLAAAGRLLLALPPVVGGFSSPALSRALCREAVSRGDPVVVVAEASGALAGYVMAVRGPAAFWKGFALRHPWIALRIAARRFVAFRGHSGTAAGGSQPATGPEAAPSGHAPADSKMSDEAKIILIGVAPGFRGRGVAATLYRHLFGLLAGRGCRRLTARVDFDNTPSIRLHRLTGWHLAPSGASYVAVRDLQDHRS
jgi:ribosomal protein S18 acetylase RimI-like enzyme